MTNEEKERIVKDAEGLSRARVWPEHTRITFKNGYIAGAIAQYNNMAEQLKQERNKAIDDCISSIIVNHHGISPSMLETLESLKK